MNKYVNKIVILTFGLFLIIAGGCHTTKKNKPGVGVSDDIRVEINSYKGDEKKLLDEAMTWIGTPYGYGHSEKGSATDCSGFILMIYDKVLGVKMPRNSAKQSEFCKKIDLKHVEPGDLVFFATGKSSTTVSHVGLMIDKERFIHASSSKGVVISSMTTPYYQNHFVMYGRVPGWR